ncbi:hypothetical protein BRADI_3g48573v3 [Brachypodium distachyon]|uniref:Uncharacterized protein n=1 Tax=Brachypodium distachyon TaxID=15368 RepID=A0A0Q3FQC8_BRADI|nr:hypothetical protein BRADI_3g48573v3 [Brachypodium distachyon]
MFRSKCASRQHVLRFQRRAIVTRSTIPPWLGSWNISKAVRRNAPDPGAGEEVNSPTRKHQDIAFGMSLAIWKIGMGLQWFQSPVSQWSS